MLLSRIRIHWSSGPKIYNNAEEAARDMRNRGLEVPEWHSSDPPLEERILMASTWQRTGERPWINLGNTAREGRREPSEGKSTRDYKMKEKKEKMNIRPIERGV